MKRLLWMTAAMVLLTSCGVDRRKYDAQVRMTDSLAAACKRLQAGNDSLTKELQGYRYDPGKLLAGIRENYAAKEYDALKANLDLLQRYHPDASELAAARSVYERAVKDREAARKKAEAEAARREAERRAKMKPIERIMEKYGCDEDIATLIHHRQVCIGMTADQCRASWGRPYRVNRSTGSYGVHEQWCYEGYNYLYFENGILRSIQN